MRKHTPLAICALLAGCGSLPPPASEPAIEKRPLQISVHNGPFTIESFPARVAYPVKGGVAYLQDGVGVRDFGGSIRWRAEVPFSRVWSFFARTMDAGSIVVTSDGTIELVFDAETGKRLRKGPQTWRSKPGWNRRKGSCYRQRNCSLTVSDCESDEPIGSYLGVEQHWYMDGSGEHTDVCTVHPALLGTVGELMILFDADRNGGKSLAMDASGSVFTHGFNGSQYHGRITAIDVNTHKPLWQSGLIPDFAQKGVFEDESICWAMGLIEPVALALDCHTGREIWSRVLFDGPRKSVLGTHVINGTIVVAVKQDSGTRVLGVNLSNGKQVWQRDVPAGEWPNLDGWFPSQPNEEVVRLVLDPVSGAVVRKEKQTKSLHCTMAGYRLTQLGAYCVMQEKNGIVAIWNGKTNTRVAEVLGGKGPKVLGTQETKDGTYAILWLSGVKDPLVVIGLPHSLD